MEITLDITKNFNYVINYCIFLGYAAMKPVVFFEQPFEFKNNFTFELMNFGLNVEETMYDDFAMKAPHFDDVVNYISMPHYMAKTILIFDKAKINITNLKGLCLQLPDSGGARYEKSRSVFGLNSKIVPAKGLYYEHPFTLKKGDYHFICGGSSSFSHHYINMDFIAGRNTKTTLTFSSGKYAIKEADDKAYENVFARKQTPNNYLDNIPRPDILSQCTEKPHKMLTAEFRKKRNEYFDENFTAMCDEM